jgi:hypothetical protein
VHPLGGTAYLSLEDAEEPFGGGIKFTAMPPTKRFRDMEQLSGGEKARSLRLQWFWVISVCVLWDSLCSMHKG